MFKRFISSVLGSCISLALLAQVPGYIPGVLEVEWSNTSQGASPQQGVANPNSKLADIMDRYRVTSFASYSPGNPSMSHFYELRFEDIARTEELMNELRKVQGIKGVYMIPEVTLDANVPKDIDLDILWYLERIKMESWDLQFNKEKPIIIAIIDNGVRITHEDIRDNLWVNDREIPGNGVDDDNNNFIDDINGWDVADWDNNPNPPANAGPGTFIHGTQVAGLASASTNNGKGIVSVGFNTVVMAVKCSKDAPVFPYTDAKLSHGWEGIEYATAAGADIINISWSQKSLTPRQQQILDSALARGILIVASAGNKEENTVLYPAAYDRVIAVTGTDANDRVVFGYGAKIDLVAPGVGLYTTFGNADNAYGFVDGTSFAAPIVSGFIGLLLSQEVEPAEVLELVKKGCDNIDIENASKIGMMGAGRINVNQTLWYLKNPDAPGVGMNENPQVFEANVYPNPNTGLLRLANGAIIEEITVYDLSGREIANMQCGDLVADLRSWQLNGLYVVRVRTEEGVGTSKVYFQ